MDGKANVLRMSQEVKAKRLTLPGHVMCFGCDMNKSPSSNSAISVVHKDVRGVCFLIQFVRDFIAPELIHF